MCVGSQPVLEVLSELLRIHCWLRIQLFRFCQVLNNWLAHLRVCLQKISWIIFATADARGLVSRTLKKKLTVMFPLPPLGGSPGIISTCKDLQDRSQFWDNTKNVRCWSLLIRLFRVQIAQLNTRFLIHSAKHGIF